MGVVLFILANSMGVVILPIGVLYGLIKSIYLEANRQMFILAVALDKYGNVVCANLFNDVLIKKTSVHRFGDINQTISKVLGYNLQGGTLTRVGRWLNWFLDKVDKGHTLKAIEEKPPLSVL